MSRREMLLVLAHAQHCGSCRTRMLSEPERVFVGHALTADEIASLAELSPDDFMTPDKLASAAGVTASELAEYQDHPIVRLRHF